MKHDNSMKHDNAMKHDNRCMMGGLVVPVLAFLMLCSFWAGCAATGGEASEKDCLAPFQGKVQVLLLGTPGCGNTESGTLFLSEYQAKLPTGAGIARFDVPPPGKSMEGLTQWEGGFQYGVDQDRALANRLDFFYYPTLYILDREGEVRYVGPCDRDRVPQVVEALVAEKPGREKTSYSPVMPAVGEAAPAFSGPSLEGKNMASSDFHGEKGTLLFFSTTTCPFSKKAIIKLPELQGSLREKGISTVIVNQGASVAEVKDFYQAAVPMIPVIVDADGTISTKQYGVLGVPFYYLLDGEGRVKERLPFTPDAATESVMAYLEQRTSNARQLALAGAG